MGCGPQETFRNCADVQISSGAVSFVPNAIDIPNTIYEPDVHAESGLKPVVVM